jgi:hypothetical protein
MVHDRENLTCDYCNCNRFTVFRDMDSEDNSVHLNCANCGREYVVVTIPDSNEFEIIDY